MSGLFRIFLVLRFASLVLAFELRDFEGLFWGLTSNFLTYVLNTRVEQYACLYMCC